MCGRPTRSGAGRLGAGTGEHGTPVTGDVVFTPGASTLAGFGMTHEDTTAKIQPARAAAAAEASRRETAE